MTAPAMSSWSKGELSPQLRGRVDTQHYFNSAESLKNCMVRPYGNVINRAGSRYVAEVKEPVEGSEGGSSETVRLIKFVFSVSQAYLIEMGEYYFRFYKDHEQIEVSQYFTEEVDNTYSDTRGNALALIALLSITVVQSQSEYFTQDHLGKFLRTRKGGKVNSELIITIVESPTRAYGIANFPLFRTGLFSAAGGDWGIFDDWYDPVLEELIPQEVTHPYTAGELNDIHYVQKDDVIFMAHKNHPPARLIRKGGVYWSYEEMEFYGGPFTDDNTDEDWKVEPTDRDVSGTPTIVTANRDTWTIDDVGKSFKIDGLNDDGEQGWGVIASYVDPQQITLLVKVTLTGESPTSVWAFQEWGPGNYPSTVTFHESRLFWGGSPDNPQKVWGSKSFIYDDHSPGSNADDAISAVLSADQANPVQWVSSGSNLSAGTFGGEFVISSKSGTLTPTDTSAKRQSGWGSEKLQPKKISNYLYYLQRGFRKVRELYYFWDIDNYKAVDMTKYSEHITLSGIKDMDYQQNPDSVLWCVLKNGKMAVMTRDVEEEVQAWCPLVTDGKVESIAVIPSPDGISDEVWIVVERNINGEDKKYLEYFENPIVDDETDQTSLFYVDSGISHNAFDATAGKILYVAALFNGNHVIRTDVDFFSESDIGKRVKGVNSDGVVVGEIRIAGYYNPQEVYGAPIVEFTEFLFVGGKWALSVTEITNLQHLTLKYVAILADGGVRSNEFRRQVNSSGVLTLASDAYVVNTGLPYQSLIKTNPIEAGAKNGTAQGKLKRIVEYALKVYRTMGIEVGDAEGTLNPTGQREVETPLGTPQPLITGEIANLQFDGDWDYDGQIVIVQNNPLPMNILGIYPKIETADKI